MEQLLSVEQLAEKLNVPVSWIYDRTRVRGPERLPHFKLGRHVRFSEEQIAAYLEVRKEIGLEAEE